MSEASGSHGEGGQFVGAVWVPNSTTEPPPTATPPEMPPPTAPPPPIPPQVRRPSYRTSYRPFSQLAIMRRRLLRGLLLTVFAVVIVSAVAVAVSKPDASSPPVTTTALGSQPGGSQPTASGPLPTKTTARVTIDALKNVVAIRAGGNQTCASLTDGRLLCWGRLNDSNERFSMTSQPTPAVVAAVKDARTFAVGEVGKCAIVTSVQCWYRSFGAVYPAAVPDPPSSTSDGTEVADVSSPIDVTVGGSFACALEAAGTVRCWGDNPYGQLGPAAPLQPSSATPVGLYRTSSYPVTGLRDVKSITAGWNHACALLRDGTVRCWGDDVEQQLGTAAPNRMSAAPVEVPGVRGAIALSAAANMSCALVPGGVVNCWGMNYYGSLGDPAAVNEYRARVVGLSGATAISVGGSYACALLGDRSVKCWGNLPRRAGDDQDNEHNVPGTPIAQTIAGVSGAIAVAAGEQHACALLAGGRMTCWGANGWGQLGNGRMTNTQFLSGWTEPARPR